MDHMHDTACSARNRRWNDPQAYKATGLLDAHRFDEGKLEAFHYQLHLRHGLDSMVMYDFLACPPATTGCLPACSSR